MNIFSNENNIVSMEEKLGDIALNMRYEYFNKNTVMFKYGDKGDKFYIILKGKIGFLTPQKVKLKLNEEEYLINLAHLYQNGEFELVKHIMLINQATFDFGDDFEKYIIEHIGEFYKKNGNYKYSIRTYHRLIEISKNNFQIKNKVTTDNISIKDYIEMNRIINGRESSKKKKQIILFYYQHVNNFEDGQTFGYMALESKNNKRTSSAITLTNCELAFLTKDDYLSILGGILNKSRNNIYELMSSFK
jgi:CRP-like cAMP-binding protein